MKKSFRKFQPRIINYMSYKQISNEAFWKCLLEKVPKEVFVNNNDELLKFCDISLQVLNQHAPQEIKHTRHNHGKTTFKKYILKKIKALQYNLLRNKTKGNKILYNGRVNYCVSLLQTGYYKNLNVIFITIFKYN